MKPNSFLRLRFWLRAGSLWWFGPMLAVVRVLVLVVLAVGPGWAQPGSGGPGPAVDPTTIPLDGGVSLLLAGGVGYALRRLRQRRAA
ncbi:MprA protease, GlyGly-CTERM protein-sorting domain-containing form [Hymenobacter antarcticus]|uniref:VPDSG-CTERM protein sorting domain-containing protein n=1 Tax=Hymenobacter antarcticus TaxID=486270 RepID=A0ABP7Q2Y0_9BACT